jgi:hypothetical protein
LDAIKTSNFQRRQNTSKKSSNIATRQLLIFLDHHFFTPKLLRNGLTEINSPSTTQKNPADIQIADLAYEPLAWLKLALKLPIRETLTQ